MPEQEKGRDQLRCARCQRFIDDDCSEGWTGGDFFGDYNGVYYCASGAGCNRSELELEATYEAVGS